MTTSPNQPRAANAARSEPVEGAALLTQYRQRLGVEAPSTPSVSALSELMTAHLATIPFETIDPWLGHGVHDLGAGALADKLLRRHRGGFCFEQNGLFGHVLDALGWSVSRITGRVLWGGAAPGTTPRTHQVLRIAGLDDRGDVLADVGFGTHNPGVPLPLGDSGVQRSVHSEYRLDQQGDTVTVLSRVTGGEDWRPLYALDLTPQPPIDLQVGSWYASTAPDTFAGSLVLGLVEPDTRWALNGTTLTEYPAGGEARHTELHDADDVLAALRDTFGIDVDRIETLDACAAKLFTRERTKP